MKKKLHSKIYKYSEYLGIYKISMQIQWQNITQQEFYFRCALIISNAQVLWKHRTFQVFHKHQGTHIPFLRERAPSWKTCSKGMLHSVQLPTCFLAVLISVRSIRISQKTVLRQEFYFPFSYLSEGKFTAAMIQGEANDLKTLTDVSGSLLLTKLEFRGLRSLGILPTLQSLVPRYQQMAMPKK